MIADGWDAFIAKLLRQVTPIPGQGLIVDGLRHPEAAEALRAAVRPWHTYVIYLDTPARLGLDRAARRDQLADPAWQQVASHPVESELPAVKAAAHLIVPMLAVTAQRVAQLVMFCLAGSSGYLSGAAASSVRHPRSVACGARGYWLWWTTREEVTCPVLADTGRGRGGAVARSTTANGRPTGWRP